MTTWILPGRHQPPHNDHLRILERALDVAPRVVVGLIVHCARDDAPSATAFERLALEENDPTRAPFSLLERIAMFDAALASWPAALRARVTLLGIPRPESDPALIEAMFPGGRVWLVPDLGDAFDDAKARWFRERGERVVRLPLEKTTDGRRVRAALDDPEALRGHVPAAVAAFISVRRKEEVHSS